LVLARSGALLLDGSEPVLAAFSTSRRFADGMVVALRGESRPIGMMLVADRLGAVASFDDDDLALFDTVAGHLSTALEHGRLEHSLGELRRLEEQVAYQSRHDPLTGLANRSLLAERLRSALLGDRVPTDALAV